ncbi:MAG: lipocalin family protein [Flavobacteriales bacterium]|nr:MAG: lipocalin family protein [Flavobacteriales bacterium]
MFSPLLVMLFAGCASKPPGMTPVRPFAVDRYLGLWYEVARLDHSFERGLEQVTAQYDRNADGSIRVLNRGYDTAQGRWKEATGKAKLAGAADEGRLKVSFFGPFYGGYNVVALDADYRHALVVGNSTKYLWILSRTPELPEEARVRYLALARELGCDPDALIWVRHDQAPANGMAPWMPH